MNVIFKVNLKSNTVYFLFVYLFIPPPTSTLHSPQPHQKPYFSFFVYVQLPQTKSTIQEKPIMSPAANSSSSSRWCPAPEQLMLLEEMYRAGIRTPNASHIQHITAQLSFYGKIEGKNVFYWFQNHKARDRQKLRRKLCKQLQQQQLLYHHHNYHNYRNCHYEQQLNQQTFLGYLETPPPVPSALHHKQLYTCHHHNNYSSTGFLPPQVGVEDAMINYTWKMEIPEKVKMEKPVMSMYGREWMMMMMMMDVRPPSPCCTSSSSSTTTTSTTTSTPPLRTLQLFPITATDLKEESTASHSALSSSTLIDNH
ncbi:hypothetical protein ACFX2I_029494 [Malus domestica]